MADDGRTWTHWLVKSEPDVYGFHHLEQDGRTMWEGVRNYQARNFIRDEMRAGDPVLYYHSSTRPTGVAGLAEVAGDPYPDPTQFDPDSRYHDPKATHERPRWFVVDLVPVRRLPRLVTLDEIKAEPSLRDMKLVQRGMRLSVMPVAAAELERIIALADAPES